MFQIRFHGRGGQGVVTAAEMLSVAAFAEGKFAQAFPSFGSERTGAPVVSFCRIDDQPIRSREPVIKPDALIVQDMTLIHQVDIFAGLLEYSEEPLVSSDIVNSPASCVFDSGLTMAQGNLVKVLGWYDNETGYSSRLADLASLVGSSEQS